MALIASAELLYCVAKNALPGNCSTNRSSFLSKLACSSSAMIGLAAASTAIQRESLKTLNWHAIGSSGAIRMYSEIAPEHCSNRPGKRLRIPSTSLVGS